MIFHNIYRDYIRRKDNYNEWFLMWELTNEVYFIVWALTFILSFKQKTGDVQNRIRNL